MAGVTADEPHDQGNVKGIVPSNKTSQPASTTANEPSSPPKMNTDASKPETVFSDPAANSAGNNANDAKIHSGDNKIDSLFSNPFDGKECISGASNEKRLDPKEVPTPGEQPLPELTMVESAVIIHEPKPVRNPFATSARTPSEPVAETIVSKPKIDKGKGRAIDIPEENARNDTPRPATVTDTGSCISRRSDRTRTESMATFSTATGASTIGSVADDRRKSHVPSTQNNPGNIPLAGGRPIGRQASVHYSQAFQYEPPLAGPSSASREEIREFYQPPYPKKSMHRSTTPVAHEVKQEPKQNAPTEPARRKSKGFFVRARKLLSSKEGSK